MTRCTGLALFLALGMARLGWAAPGDLDPSFAGVGFVHPPEATAARVAVLPDGRIIGAAQTYPDEEEIFVFRLLRTGELDPSWGEGGEVRTPVDGAWGVQGVALNESGSVLVLVVGDFGLRLLQFPADGRRRPATHVPPVRSRGGSELLAVQPDDKPVIAGFWGPDAALARLTVGGDPDPTFGDDGRVRATFGPSQFRALALQPDGKILVAGEDGSEIAIARYLPDGTLDSSFGSSGSVAIDVGFNGGGTVLGIQVDGAILVTRHDRVYRLSSNGSVDPSFGTGGVYVAPFGIESSRTQNDGHTLLGGSTSIQPPEILESLAGIVRIDAAGALDPTWGDEGIFLRSFGSLQEAIYSMIVDQGRLIFAGRAGHAGTEALVAVLESGEFCGDGIVQSNESCDEGRLAAGSCCTTGCTFEPTTTPCEDDGEFCTADRCDSGACTHPPVADGTPCDDGSLCVVGEACSAGACVGGTTDGIGCPQAHICYKAARTPSTPKFTAVREIQLADSLWGGTYDATKVFELCVPADVSPHEIEHPEVRQLAYRIKPSSRPRATPKYTGLVVEDMFGVHTLDTGKPDLLFVPSGLSRNAPATAPPIGTALHYRCYKAKQTKGATKFDKTTALASGEFETRLYDVLAPRRLCYATDKNDEGVLDPDTLLTCYRIRRAKDEPAHDQLESVIHTSNQFGALQLDTKKAKDLCVPARPIE